MKLKILNRHSERIRKYGHWRVMPRFTLKFQSFDEKTTKCFREGDFFYVAPYSLCIIHAAMLTSKTNFNRKLHQ